MPVPNQGSGSGAGVNGKYPGDSKWIQWARLSHRSEEEGKEKQQRRVPII